MVFSKAQGPPELSFAVSAFSRTAQQNAADLLEEQQVVSSGHTQPERSSLSPASGISITIVSLKECQCLTRALLGVIATLAYPTFPSGVSRIAKG